jgi:hypothetical protein
MSKREFKIKVDRIADLAEDFEMFAVANDWTPQEVYLVCRFLAIFHEVVNGAYWHDELVMRSEFLAMMTDKKVPPGGSGETGPPQGTPLN